MPNLAEAFLTLFQFCCIKSLMRIYHFVYFVYVFFFRAYFYIIFYVVLVIVQ